MLLPILPLMPDELFTQDPPVELAFSMSDGPRGMVHNTVRDRSESLGRAGKGASLSIATGVASP
jgi:hypothetical protein